ncbi:Hypp1622 [Branchiostoma lanceolatum]|uniref:Hypp1622 protein n=1 Tax=Branchiostoma lanceolatum TaxID=7740 RepID=A0A8J9ZMT2_BRALA|nr:Hypp1622 [Branchiostoma lanceolatum]
MIVTTGGKGNEKGQRSDLGLLVPGCTAHARHQGAAGSRLQGRRREEGRFKGQSSMQDTSTRPPVITPLVFDHRAANDPTKPRDAAPPAHSLTADMNLASSRLFHAYPRGQRRAETDNTLPGPPYKPLRPELLWWSGLWGGKDASTAPVFS